MNRVFVIQSTRFQADVSPAQAYGTVEFVLGVGDRTSCSPELSRTRLERGLREFDEDRDYILWSGGDPLSFLLAGCVLRDMGVKRVRYLRYERPDANKRGSAPFYVPVNVEL